MPVYPASTYIQMIWVVLVVSSMYPSSGFVQNILYTNITQLIPLLTPLTLLTCTLYCVHNYNDYCFDSFDSN